MTATEAKLAQILIVEDSPTQAFSLKKDLETKGFSPEVALNSLEALETIKKSAYRVVISDIQMPKMDGYELCREIKSLQRDPKTIVILLTALSDPLDVIKGIEVGADSFLTKPYDVKLLSSLIEDLIDRDVTSKAAIEKVSISYHGQRFVVPINPLQIVDLLLSTYTSAIQKNKELDLALRNLTLAHFELRQKNEELAKLNTEKNQFLGMAIHDLRTPLSTIQGYTEILTEQLKGRVDEKSLSKLSHIKQSSQLMIEIINELLDISSIEAGKIDLKLTEENFISLVQNAVSINEGLAEKKNIILCLHTEDQNILVHCDRQRMEQVITHLLTNAINVSPTNSQIDVHLQQADEEVILIVKDEGPGIPKEKLEGLFNAPRKLHGSKDAGFGLSIAKKIVQEHKGKIWADSSSEKGTSFFVSLPKN